MIPVRGYQGLRVGVLGLGNVRTAVFPSRCYFGLPNEKKVSKRVAASHDFFKEKREIGK